MSLDCNVERMGDARQTWYVHGARDGRAHAMGRRVRDLAAQARNMTVRTCYEMPAAADAIGRDFDEDGFIDLEWLAAHTPTAEGHVLSLRGATVPARVRQRVGAPRRTAASDPLRVLRAGG